MKKILIATSNKHKIEEMKDALLHLNYEVYSPLDFDGEDEVVEDGISFKENATIKAKYYYDKYHLPTVADDSGISIDYFKDFPGLYSSRFLKHLDYKKKNKLICNIMKGVSNRKAHYTCHLVYINDKNIEHFESFFNGEIADKPSGSNGFGYDPIFYLSEYNKTVADLSPSIKSKISHRAKSLRKLVDYLEKY